MIDNQEYVLKLTPLEIRKQEFKKGLRGFDPVEVQTFLEMVSEQYEQLQEENKDFSRKILELETRLRSYQDNDKTLRDTLFNMQEVKKQSEEASKRQADLHIKEAELKALEILESARKESRKIREEVNWLKSQKESFINRIRHVLVSQIELLSVMELDDVLSPEAKEKLDLWRKHRGIQSRMIDSSSTPEPQVTQSEPITIDENNTGEDELETDEGRLVQTYDDTDEVAEKTNKSATDETLTEEDIDDFFKKGLQIDDLIKNINKNK